MRRREEELEGQLAEEEAEELLEERKLVSVIMTHRKSAELGQVGIFIYLLTLLVLHF